MTIMVSKSKCNLRFIKKNRDLFVIEISFLFLNLNEF